MEEIYELIKRIDIEFFYDYKHFLLKTYLIVKLEKLIENYSKETKLQIYEILYESLEEIYYDYLKGKISEIEIKFYLTWSLNISEGAFNISHNDWIERYINCLLKYENYYSYQNKQNNSIIFLNKAFEVIEPYFQNNIIQEF